MERRTTRPMRDLITVGTVKDAQVPDKSIENGSWPIAGQGPNGGQVMTASMAFFNALGCAGLVGAVFFSSITGAQVLELFATQAGADLREPGLLLFVHVVG